MKAFFLATMLVLFAASAQSVEAQETFSLYGARLGDALRQVIDNGVARGYMVESSIVAPEDKARGVSPMASKWKKDLLFGVDYALREAPNVNMPADERRINFISDNLPAVDDADSGMAYVIYKGGNIPYTRILLQRDGDSEPKVFSVNATAGELANHVFAEKYGEPPLRGIGHSETRVWKKGKNVATVSQSGDVFLCDVDAYGEVVARIGPILDRMADENRKRGKEKQREEIEKKKSEM